MGGDPVHRQGLIHNDIKPSYVLVSDGRLNFVDLDSVRPKNEVPLYALTPMYTERLLLKLQMSYNAKHNPGNLYLQFD